MTPALQSRRLGGAACRVAHQCCGPAVASDAAPSTPISLPRGGGRERPRPVPLVRARPAFGGASPAFSEGGALLHEQRRHMAAGFNFGGGFYGHQQNANHGRGGGDDKFYRILGVERQASESEIKSAYKKQAMKHHPDRGGDEATFKDISKAYEVLSNPEKRQLYDAYGEHGLDSAEQGGGGPGMGADAFEMFSQIFGFNPGAQQRGRPRTKDMMYELKLSLEELYQGTTRDIHFTRSVVCRSCDGYGGRNPSMCQRCKGTGQQVQMQQMGFFVQQVRSICTSCSGTGFVIAAADKCQTCKGKGTESEKKTYTIDVEPGALDRQEFRFRAQADEAPGHETGDVVIQIQQKTHKVFQRAQESLIMNKKVSLVEALCGFQFSIPFLDGKDLRVQSKPGQIVKPGDLMVVPGSGMPRKHGRQHGDLFIMLEVEFPAELSPEQRQHLHGMFGGEEIPEQPPVGTQTAAKLTARQAQAQRERWAEFSKKRERGSREQAECVQQ